MRVAVVGGNVAGAFLALQLAETHHHTTVFDHRAPWEKPCGGAIHLDALARFPTLQGLSQLGHRPSTFTYVSSEGQEIPSPASDTKWAVFSRRDLNGALLDRALAGDNVNVVRERVADVAPDGDGWQLRTAEGSLHQADILVGADGATSLVRRKLVGGIAKRHLLATVGYMVTGVDLDRLIIKTFRDLEGYLWCFPRADHASLGIGGRLGTMSTKGLWERLDGFMAEGYPQVRVQRRWGALLPSVSHPSFWELPCAGPNWALIGDAAAHVDPITGAGIPYALRSAELAAEAIGGSGIEAYDWSWREAYGAHLSRASSLVDTLQELRRGTGHCGFEEVLRRILIGGR